MEILKNKQLWLGFIIMMTAFVISHWLFEGGWKVIRGDISFQESIADFKLPMYYVIIAITAAIAHARYKK